MEKLLKSNWLVLILSLILVNSVYAQDSPGRYDHKEINNWGKWGKKDERGAANYITPEVIVNASKLIRKGKTFSLSIPIDKTGPIYPSRLRPHHSMDITGSDYTTGVDHTPILGDMKYADDYLFIALQGSTQWDGLGHVWYGDQLYNGFPEEAIVSSGWGGATKLGIQNVKNSFIGRGVLIDIVRFKGGNLPKGYEITRDDIEKALIQQGTEVQSGDMVIVRTGVVPDWYQNTDPEYRSNYFNPQTGIGKDVVLWIKEKEITGMAADNIGLERQPSAIDPKTVVPLHGNILRDLGVYIGEIWWLEDLAVDCAEDGVYEFFLAAQPLNIPGAVGTPVNPIAIK